MNFYVEYIARVLHPFFFPVILKFIEFFLSPLQGEGKVKQGRSLRFILSP
jgi:hypothetical protein